jgi:hypothetical protein
MCVCDTVVPLAQFVLSPYFRNRSTVRVECKHNTTYQPLLIQNTIYLQFIMWDAFQTVSTKYLILILMYVTGLDYDSRLVEHYTWFVCLCKVSYLFKMRHTNVMEDGRDGQNWIKKFVSTSWMQEPELGNTLSLCLSTTALVNVDTKFHPFCAPEPVELRVVATLTPVKEPPVPIRCDSMVKGQGRSSTVVTCQQCVPRSALYNFSCGSGFRIFPLVQGLRRIEQ